MNHEIKKIPFENGELLGVRTEDGKVWLGVKKACLDIGLSEDQARGQLRKVQMSLLFSDNWIKLRVKFSTQIREIVVLSEKFVPIWLAQINLTPTMQRENPEAIQRLLKYQRDAADVLHNAFMGTDEKKQALYNDMGLHGEILEIKEEITSLKEEVQSLIDNTTINSRQAQKLLFAAKDRVNWLLGGAHTKEYRANSRMYFKNLWLGLCSQFEVGSYKDLNPVHMQRAMEYIGDWVYLED